MSLEFESSPSLATLYPRVLLARKPAWVRDGATVPPISAVLRRLRVDRSHLRAYRELCGYDADGQLPLPYPHVLAAALHLAVLASDAFPVRLLGLVHIRNRIRLHAALPDDVAGSLHVAIAGHVDTDRGQEFTLQTRLLDPHDECLWEEDSVFLARRRSGAARSGSGARSETVSAGVRTT
ncbi:MAG: hypothetical protein NZM12_05810, partial [Steroidobacteraceae bacterium]|nr:hypothetical protein [Steroidobacteraceae bacterium]